MKLLSYSRKGEVSFGIGKSNGLIDLGERLKNKLPAKTIINFLTFFDHDFFLIFAGISSRCLSAPNITSADKINSL